MRNFLSLLKLELKRPLSIKNLVVLALVFITLFYFTFSSFYEYNSIPDKEANFILNGRKYFERMNNYVTYSNVGIKILFLPSQQGILFTNGILLNNSVASVNSMFLMELSNNLEGKSITPGTTLDYTNYATLMMAILSLIAIFYGYRGVSNKDFFRTVNSLSRSKFIYFSFLLARFLSMVGYVLILNLLFLAILAISGFNISGSDLITFGGFFISLLIVLFIFFLIGSILGNMRLKKSIGLTVVIIWFLMVFLFPPLFNSFSSKDFTEISNTIEANSEKMEIINQFESKADQLFGKKDMSNIEQERKITEGYWNHEFKNVEGIDLNINKLKEKAIRKYQITSIFTPVSFYNMTALEAGSKGYENYLKFTDYAIKKRREFLRFWIDRVYYNDPKVMVNFINNNENIFHGQGALPSTFAAGAGVNMVYIIILFIISNALFHRSIFLVDKKNLKFREPVKTLIHQEKVQDIYVCKDGRFKNILFSMFSGFGDYLYKNGFEGKFIDQLGKIDFSLKSQDFVYICDPDELPPETKVGDLLAFFACLGRTKKEKRKMILEMPEISAIANRTIESLSNDEKCDVMLALISLIDKKIYLVYNIGSNSSWQYVVKTVKHLEKLSETAERVLYLTNKPDVEEEKRYPDSPQSEYARWLVGAQIVKNKLDNERTIKKESKD